MSIAMNESPFSPRDLARRRRRQWRSTANKPRSGKTVAAR